MKKFTQVIFTLAMVVGIALSASAQKDDQKNRPPKEKPPVVDPGKKPPRGNPPPRDDKKKPGSEFYLVSLSRENDIV